ncbi:hypothetical protein M427DRAFT_222038 [Gonapodya prolifera JEL478]|uniref:SH3 domain-containing protein n=1 Tax=Gonapodya prolifera (strain JEL478) TaxID=1344416 RepID=A0A139AMV5_GONPJ|nr:hypothetical protein M427DRAFT_222038 [Gonapodya prolifera JEL478]|eukprot:KXS18100.1 hypothetical protein M427DRAFT_222038 [Gonapodya prolifera JEL478]
MAKVSTDYNSQRANCISLKAGSIVYVYNMDPSGWWDGMSESRRGWFPSDFVTIIGANSPVDTPQSAQFGDPGIGTTDAGNHVSKEFLPSTPPLPSKPPPLPSKAPPDTAPSTLESPATFVDETSAMSSPSTDSPTPSTTASTLHSNSNFGYPGRKSLVDASPPIDRRILPRLTGKFCAPTTDLPSDWRIKRTTYDDREYYVNVRTNFTTFNKDDIFRRATSSNIVEMPQQASTQNEGTRRTDECHHDGHGKQPVSQSIHFCHECPTPLFLCSPSHPADSIAKGRQVLHQYRTI